MYAFGVPDFATALLARVRGVSVTEVVLVRSFVKLTKFESVELARRFPELPDLISSEEVDSLDQYALSVFDHWLSPKAAITQIDNISEEQEKIHNLKFARFLGDISAETQAYLIKLNGRRKSNLTFRRFLSQEGLRKYLQPKHHMVNDSFRCILLFPAIETVYFEGCDFTHHFFCRKSDAKELIEKIAKANQLNIFE